MGALDAAYTECSDAMRRALVTGATGHLGAHLCHRLWREGAEIHAVSRQAQVDDRGEIRWWRADSRDTQVQFHEPGELRPHPSSASLVT
jgi:NAD(P)-dependent dehydrogenase (short-subunit alcohol dehydrogenase family)